MRELVAIDLGDDLHDPSINGIALTGQLRQLREKHLKTFTGREFHDVRSYVRRHDSMIAAASDTMSDPARGYAPAATSSRNCSARG